MRNSVDEGLLDRERAVKAQESYLTDARKQRRDVDDHLQALMNRIAYLAQEEAKLDKDIDSARRRAAQALARQAERDEDIAPTAQELLATLPDTQQPYKPRPHTGRSGLLANGLPPGVSAVRAQGSTLSGTASTSSLATTTAGSGRAPSAARGRPPVAPSSGAAPAPAPASTAARSLDKSRSQGSGSPLPGTARPGTSSRSLPSSKSPSPGKQLTGAADSTLHAAPRRAAAASGEVAACRPSTRQSAGSGSIEHVPPGLRSGPRADSAQAGMVCLAPGSHASASMAAPPASHQHTDAQAAVGGPNSMTVIRPGPEGDLLNEEILEELQHTTGRSAGSGSSAGPSGLQEFTTDAGGKRVVQVRATRKGEGATVVAGGVGWGLSARGAPVPIAPKEAKQLQAEVQKKQQIWKVRKTFGLEPTPQSDASAQIEEVGAGAWGK